MIDAVLTVVGSCSVYSLDLYLYAIEPAFHSGEVGSSTELSHVRAAASAQSAQIGLKSRY